MIDVDALMKPIREVMPPYSTGDPAHVALDALRREYEIAQGYREEAERRVKELEQALREIATTVTRDDTQGIIARRALK